MWTVEVRPKGRDRKGEHLQRQIAEDLGIAVRAVQTSEVYYIDGGNVKKKIVAGILHDMLVQEAGEPRDSDAWMVEVRYKPSVTDPAEQSVLKACRDAGAAVAEVTIAQRYHIGASARKDAERIGEELLANKVVHDIFYGKGSLDAPLPRKIRGVENDTVEHVQLIGASEQQLRMISRKNMLSLNLGEMKAVQRHFAGKERNPTDAEMETVAQTWSEHCKHKTLNSAVEYREAGKVRRYGNLFRETIVSATKDVARGKPWLVSVFRDNAGIIKFDGRHSIAFKVETHNHPSALDPYGGAGTGIGGVIRDVLGAGLGAKPIFNTDVFCVGLPDQKNVPESIQHPKRVLNGLIAGVRDYGNRMGIPTISGAVLFDERYLGVPLVYAGTAGLIPTSMAAKRAKEGDAIVVVGGRTGRDGLHGATFSSAVLDGESPVSAVQIGNAIEEKRMMDALLAARDEKLYTAITDCGAGGFSSAIGEMAASLGCEVQLKNVPLKYSGMRPWEIWLSESQERMVVAVPGKNVKRLLEICLREGTEATVMGKFTATKKLVVRYGEKRVVDMDMDFLHHGLPKQERRAVWKKQELKEPKLQQKKEYKGVLKQLLHQPTIASKEWVIRQYDHEVQGNTIGKPLTGVENSGPADASSVQPVPGSAKRVVVSHGINPLYSGIDSYWMALAAVDEALRNIVAAGGDISHTAILDNFCWADTSSPERLGTLVRAAEGCRDAALGYCVPFISGKDSLHNERVVEGRKLAVPDTLLISAISVADVETTTTMDLKKAGSSIYIVGMTKDELGGSAYYALHEVIGANVPKAEPAAARRIMAALGRAIRGGLVLSCHDCSEGGLAVAAAEMAFSGGIGMTLELGKVPYDGDGRDDCILFAESATRFLVEVRNGGAFEKAMGKAAARIGTATAAKKMVVRGVSGKVVVDATLGELRKAWKRES